MEKDAYDPTIFIPNLRNEGTTRPFKYSDNQLKTIGEYGSVPISEEIAWNLDRAASEYLVERKQFNQGAKYRDIKRHGKNVSKKIDDLLSLLDETSSDSYYFNFFMDNYFSLCSSLRIETVNANLKRLKTATEAVTQKNAVRDKDYAFISFVHKLAEIYLKAGGSRDEFPTGPSKLFDDNKSDSKEYDSLFVDFVMQAIAALNEQLKDDEIIAKKIYDPDSFAILSQWFEPIKQRNSQSLAKAIQRALTDKPLQNFY